MCGPDSVLSPCRMVCAVAVALWRWVLHSGGFLDAVRSGSLVSPIVTRLCFEGDFMGWKRLLATAAKFVSASVALRSGSVRTYVPIRPDVLCRGDKLRDLRR